jgi:hypothetical protein
MDEDGELCNWEYELKFAEDLAGVILEQLCFGYCHAVCC